MGALKGVALDGSRRSLLAGCAAAEHGDSDQPAPEKGLGSRVELLAIT